MPNSIDQAIVLRHWDYSETSQTVSLLCRDRGLLRGLAKGSRRDRSPFSGGFESLTRGELIAIVKPTVELATLTSWDLQEIYWGPRRDLRAHRAGLYMVDLVGHGIVDHDPHPLLFDALAQSLRNLVDPESVNSVLLQFQWSLLTEVGLSPRLQAQSGLSSARAWIFDAHEGGVTGPATGANGRSGPGRWMVRSETIDLLQDLSGPDPVLDADRRTVARASRLLAEYLRVALDADLTTRRALFEPRVDARARDR